MHEEIMTSRTTQEETMVNQVNEEQVVHAVENSNLPWRSDFLPAGFDPGLKLAIIHGDPEKAGEFTLRLEFPTGYRFPVHWHPSAESLTVISGIFQLGVGHAANENALRNYAPGDFIYVPPHLAHFGGSTTDGPSIIQIHGEGPFEVTLGVSK
jgi:quercetin dioxygenase-like cupin family protein